MSMCHVSRFEAQESQHLKREGHKIFLSRDLLSRTSVPLWWTPRMHRSRHEAEASKSLSFVLITLIKTAAWCDRALSIIRPSGFTTKLGQASRRVPLLALTAKKLLAAADWIVAGTVTMYLS